MQILLTALAATKVGADTCVNTAAFGRTNEPFLRRILSLSEGVRRHDKFWQVFRVLDPEAFEIRFGRFVTTFTAQAILDRRGDHIPALKGSRPALLNDVRRIARRSAVAPDVAEAHAWPGAQAIGKVTATRGSGGVATIVTRYFLLFRPLPATRFAELVRMHWQIETTLHWVLDVVMDEDQSRSRKNHASENLAPACAVSRST